MKHSIIFLGPSLRISAARKVVEADYRPPVAMGDVYAAGKSNPEMIVIVDGVFGSQPAVMHQEIIWCLRQNIPVIGCSSMGAIRAAELSSIGMVGWGRVFELFHRQVLSDDDEVALAHAPPELGSVPLTLAMVDIRYALSVANNMGIIDSHEHERLIKEAKRLHFGQRTLESLTQIAMSNSMSANVTGLLEDVAFFEKHSLKHQDVMSLLTEIAYGDFKPVAKTPIPHSTAIWHRAMRELDAGRGRNLMIE